MSIMKKPKCSMVLSLSVVLTALLINSVASYNLSPKPNLVVKDPQLATDLPKVESSYFGFAINLRPLGIFVGAPRAQSTLPSQRTINETGAIYRCSLTDATCNPYVFEAKGNIVAETNEYTYNSEKRDYQWLGAAMDGGTQDSDKLVVCAPRFVVPLPNDYLMHGICYWVNDTLGTGQVATNVQTIEPLRLKDNQIKTEDGHQYYYYMLGELGLSAHISANNEEILIGAPGIYTWKGSVIRYRKNIDYRDPSLSRRDVSGRRVSRDTGGEMERDIPNPEKWNQQSDSYFGYSVGSGYFDSNNLKKLLYVATAPQANEQSGEAYVFDMNKETIIKNFVFRGSQFGEYFGYAVLTDDLNGDGLTDVVVSAPQYSITGSFEDGAIYVFTNLGNFNFERKLLTSPVSGRARFGTTLSKLGDINHDGFNDIAVGSPFAGNGCVFIYLGSEKGLRDQYSQKLDSPTPAQSKDDNHMFGHGLSKGSDIDNNGFNDFAVGAPNAETVFVYRSYPVVKVLATITSQTREIKPDQNTFKVTVCYSISTTSTRMNSQELALRVVVDPKVNRVKLVQTQSNEMSFNVSAGTTQQCRALDCEVRYSVVDIFKPIELELHHELINDGPKHDDFCDICAAVDPMESKVFTEKLIFSTGCASDICVANLQVKSSNLADSFIMGSSRTLTVSYEVSNIGETAYLPQINITSSNRMSFSKTPSNCKVNNNNDVLLCDLNGRRPMAKGSRDSIQVSYDVSSVSGKAMTLTAEVFSTGNEETPADNTVKDVILLKEFTDIEVVGIAKTPHINLEKVTNTSEVINNYEIKSNGPSTISALDIVFNIPVAYKVGATATIPIIDMNNINMQAVYDSQLIGIDFYQNTTQILMNTFEYSSTTSTSVKYSNNINMANANGIHYDAVKSGHVMEISGIDNSLSDSVMVASMSSHRRRRRRETAALTATRDQYARISHIKAHNLLTDELKNEYPVNRTIVFNCNDSETTLCVRAVLRIYNFKPEKPVTVTMKYQVDLNEVNEILIEPWEFFIVLIDVNFNKMNGIFDNNELKISKKIEYNIISKHQLYRTPIWVYILAVLGGLLTLALITYIMYKSGFFKRTTKDEMDKLVHQNQDGADGDTETANLNSENN